MRGKAIIKQLAVQHGLDFQGLSDDGILHYGLTDKSRLKAFKSFLRKYKLHYRAERTQESESSGVHTMKIRTDRDHKLLKLRRTKAKIDQNTKNTKNTKITRPSKAVRFTRHKPSKAIGLIMAGLRVSSEQTSIRESLLLNSTVWSRLEDSCFTPLLHSTIPSIVDFRDLLDECQWFFRQIHEPELLDKYLKLIEKVDVLLDVISYKIRKADKPEDISLELYQVRDDIESISQILRNICSILVIKLTTATHRPITAFIQELSPFWSDITDTWNKYKDVLIQDWLDFYEAGSSQLDQIIESIDYTDKSVTYKLLTISQLLRKNSYHRMAEDITVLAHDAIEEELASGQVPAYSSTSGNWYVCRDMCPNISLPSKLTLVTDKFAYCKLRTEGKKCPSFNGVRGSSVLCADAGTYKTGAYFSNIQEITDPELIDQLTSIAKEDNNVLLLFKKAEVADNVLYYATISDDRIRIFLDKYPSSKRVGSYVYSIYYIAGEPLMVTSNMVISADKSLLEDLDKGNPMAKVATVRTAAVLRLTFTGNANMDIAFVDHLRKLNAEKFGPNTWDIPFKLEADKDRILNDLKVDFGYPVQVLQVVESLDRTLSPWSYDVYASTLLSKMKLVDSLSYEEESPKLGLSDKLYDIAAQVKNPEKYITLASNLRVKYNYIVVPQDDLVYSDGYYSVKHPKGACLMTESGQVAQVSDDGLVSIENGQTVTSPVTYLPSEITQQSDSSFIIKISPEALSQMINLFKVEPPVSEFSEVQQQEDCGCSDSEPDMESDSEIEPRKLVFKLSSKLAGDTTKSVGVSYTGQETTEIVNPLSVLKDNLDEFTSLMSSLSANSEIKESISDLQTAAFSISKLLQKVASQLDSILQPGLDESVSKVKPSSGLNEFASMLSVYAKDFSELEDLSSLLASTIKTNTEKDKSLPVKHTLPKKDIKVPEGTSNG